MKDLGRNDMCPCGSGKKYKNCCLNSSDNKIKLGRMFVSMFYPEYICVSEKSALILEVDKKQVVVLIKKHLTPLEILDFDNSIVQKNNEFYTIKNPVHDINDVQIAVGANSMIVKLLDYKSYLHKLYTPRFYTEIMIVYETEEEESTNASTFAFHNKVLTEFINAYRLITKDVEVKSPQELYNDSLVIKTSWIRYAEAELLCGFNERIVSTIEIESFEIRELKYEKYGGSIPKRDSEREKITGECLAEFFEQNHKITLIDELVIKAIEEYKVNKNYKYALLNAFTAVEVTVSEFLNEFKVVNGVSKKKLDDYKTEISISYMLNVEVPIAMKDLTEEGRTIIGSVDKIRKKRNAVIHSGDQVSDKEAIDAINSVLKLLGLIYPSRHEILRFAL